jgi:imidazolonepropionase-like amidohydrolase
MKQNIALFFILIIWSLIAVQPAFAQKNEQPPTLVLISNVNIFDGKSETLHKNMHVLIKGNLIEKISSEPLAVIQTDNVTVINGGGRTLMPGMIDVHWHSVLSNISVAEFMNADIGDITIAGLLGNEQVLMRGFTTVRDIGGNAFAIKKTIDAGKFPGPRMLVSGGPMGQTGGHMDVYPYTDVPRNPSAPLSYLERNGMLAIADGVPEVTRKAREIIRLGASQIKIAGGGGVGSIYDPVDVTQYSFDEMKAIVDVAENWNTYVAAHIFTDKAIQRAIKAGVKTIEHGNLIMEDETLQMMKDNGVWLSAQPLLDDEDRLVFPTADSTAKWKVVTDGTGKVYEAAKRIGVRIAWGTDSLYSPESAARQGKLVAKMKKWFTPYEILKMVTSNNAEVIYLSGPRNSYQKGPLGVIVEGAYADMLLVDGNPLENIDLVANPDKNFVVIMKDGKIYKNAIK